MTSDTAAQARHTHPGKPGTLTTLKLTLQHVAREVGHDQRHGGAGQVDRPEAPPVRTAAAERLPVSVLRQVGERGERDGEAEVVREGLRPRRRGYSEYPRQQERPASAAHCAHTACLHQLSPEFKTVHFRTHYFFSKPT